MGYDMREGTIVRWLKVEGDIVERGEPVAEIETDKAVVTVQAYTGGILRKIIANEGMTVLVGRPIGIVAGADEKLPDFEEEKPPQHSSSNKDIKDMYTEISTQSSLTPHLNKDNLIRSIKVSPLARRLADEKGIDISTVKGTGPGGRITKEDILLISDLSKKTNSLINPTTIELSPMRKSIAFVTTQSKQTIPHFYLSIEIDMTESIRLKDKLNSNIDHQNNPIHMNDLMIYSCAKALAKHEKFNSTFNKDYLVLHSAINIGIIVAVPDGLVMPVVGDCRDKNINEIARLSKGVIRRAREGKLTEQDYAETAFSISNLGMYKIESFFAIINPSNTATLALGTIQKKPVIRGSKIDIVDMMTANLSVDHRVADGVEAAGFLNVIRDYLEKPYV